MADHSRETKTMPTPDSTPQPAAQPLPAAPKVKIEDADEGTSPMPTIPLPSATPDKIEVQSEAKPTTTLKRKREDDTDCTLTSLAIKHEVCANAIPTDPILKHEATSSSPTTPTSHISPAPAIKNEPSDLNHLRRALSTNPAMRKQFLAMQCRLFVEAALNDGYSWAEVLWEMSGAAGRARSQDEAR
jgi:hypothetical protein